MEIEPKLSVLENIRFLGCIIATWKHGSGNVIKVLKTKVTRNKHYGMDDAKMKYCRQDCVGRHARWVIIKEP